MTIINCVLICISSTQDLKGIALDVDSECRGLWTLTTFPPIIIHTTFTYPNALFIYVLQKNL